MKTLSASLIVIALATGAGHAQLSAATDAAARTTQQTELERTGPVDLRGRSDVSGQLRQDLHAETPRSRLEQMRLDRAEREAWQTGEVAARARSDVEARTGFTFGYNRGFRFLRLGLRRIHIFVECLRFLCWPTTCPHGNNTDQADMRA